MLENQVIYGKKGTMKHGNSIEGLGNGQHYVKSLSYYQNIIDKIKNIDINRIILIGGYHLDSDHSKSEEYVSKIKHFFEKHNYQVETRIGEDPDDDFILMSNSTYFIPSGGTFSMLISKMVEMNGKNVIN